MNNECCAKCRYFHRLKHNFKVGEGFEESYCCDVLLHLPKDESEGWVDEVEPQDICEMYKETDHIADTDKKIESTPNDCETCIHNKGVLECDMYGCKYEPTTKNDKVDCEHTDCKNCVNHKYCDYEPNCSEIPTGSITKNCRSCRNFGSHHGICEICKDNSCWTEKEPTKNDDVVALNFSDDIDTPNKYQTSDGKWHEGRILTTKNDLADGKDNNVTSKITREEVIEQLQDAKIGYKEYLSNDALNMAIEALEHPERNVVAIVPCGDCISRADARSLVIKIGTKDILGMSGKAFQDLYKGIDELPSVTPQLKHGIWQQINKNEVNVIPEYKCSECGAEYKGFGFDFDYCPRCGCAMEEEE